MAHPPGDLAERFWKKVDRSGGPDACWLWTAALDTYGYGVFSIFERGRWIANRAHRVAFRLHTGSLPATDLDHLCRTRRCVNPTHLEPVTRRENLLRGNTISARNAAVTHCPAGHPYDEENTGMQRRPRGTVSRRCLTCHRQQERDRWRSAHPEKVAV